MPTFTDPRTWVTDELVTAAIMNAHVRDNFNAVPHLLVYKSADESVVSSTTLQDDNDLVYALGASELWYITLDLVMTGDAPTPAAKLAFTIPTSATMTFTAAAYNAAGSVFAWKQWIASGTGNDVLVNSGGVVINVRGIVETSSTAGNFQVQFAQNTSGATPTVMKKGTTMWGMQLA